MDIEGIIGDLISKNIIPTNIFNCEPLKGGTVSQLYLISNSNGERIVVKGNEPRILQAEASFLDFYKKENLLPKLLYVEDSYQYIVYEFISGFTNYNINNKKKLLISLVKLLLNHYKRVPNPIGWGWADEPTESWQMFLFERVKEATNIVGSYLEKEDINLVVKLVNSPNRKSVTSSPFLLHGDLGVHNFVWDGEQLTGVIDPAPVYGEPLYDLIYAYCSSPEDLTAEVIESAVSHLSNKEKISTHILYEEVLIGLYLRIASCVKHHPQDIDGYLNAWNYWKNLIE
ncbi:phosphotransferase [Neobacillus sp. PS2-9]|uniref:phosphotransferase n=1 Tax=Neobacillus sp. PS2-9 TaxID=3070676 RepID=UPI0027DEE2B1|nr:phosphotransferase [Neobacillus sp. PS2-9]WML57691.1 phosphotransferase [Neobacillus sp. PS2-9]